MNALQFIVEHGVDLLGAAVLILSGVIVIAEIIPGEQPEKTLYKVVDFLKKFSKK
jgi:glutaminase